MKMQYVLCVFFIYCFFSENIVPILAKNIVETNKTHKLKSGDIVYITAYVDLFNIYVRKVNDNDDFKKLNKIVDAFCCSG